MGLFSNKKKMHEEDMPEFLCDTVITLAWEEKTPSIREEYGYMEPGQIRFEQFRTIAITSAYYFAFLRLNLVGNTNIQKLESFLIKSKDMFPEKFGKRTMFIYEEEDKENMKNMLKQAYNNAIQSIIEANNGRIEDIPHLVAKQYALDMYKDANLSKEKLDEIIEVRKSICEELIKNMFFKTRNLGHNISITKKEKYKGAYIPYEVVQKQKTDKLLQMLNASDEEKAQFLMDMLKK